MFYTLSWDSLPTNCFPDTLMSCVISLISSVEWKIQITGRVSQCQSTLTPLVRVPLWAHRLIANRGLPTCWRLTDWRFFVWWKSDCGLFNKDLLVTLSLSITVLIVRWWVQVYKWSLQHNFVKNSPRLLLILQRQTYSLFFNWSVLCINLYGVVTNWIALRKQKLLLYLVKVKRIYATILT